jgi:hypothetical protein
MELQHQSNDDLDTTAIETRDTLFILGGAALVVFGAGLILSTPAVQRLLGGQGIGSMVKAAIPDFQRYMKLKSM